MKRRKLAPLWQRDADRRRAHAELMRGSRDGGSHCLVIAGKIRVWTPTPKETTRQMLVRRLGVVPLADLNVRTVGGRKELKRRLALAAAEYPNAWQNQTQRFVGKVKLKNVPGYRQRWRWKHKPDRV